MSEYELLDYSYRQKLFDKRGIWTVFHQYVCEYGPEVTKDEKNTFHNTDNDILAREFSRAWNKLALKRKLYHSVGIFWLFYLPEIDAFVDVWPNCSMCYIVFHSLGIRGILLWLMLLMWRLTETKQNQFVFYMFCLWIKQWNIFVHKEMKYFLWLSFGGFSKLLMFYEVVINIVFILFIC